MDLPPTWEMVHQTDPGTHFPETPQDQALQAHPPTWESWTITQLSLKPCNCFSSLGVVAWAPVPFQTRCSTSSVKRWLFTIELNISSSPHHPGDKSGSTEQPHVGKEGQGRDPPTRPTVRQDVIPKTSWTWRILTRYEPNCHNQIFNAPTRPCVEKAWCHVAAIDVLPDKEASVQEDRSITCNIYFSTVHSINSF